MLLILFGFSETQLSFISIAVEINSASVDNMPQKGAYRYKTYRNI